MGGDVGREYPFFPVSALEGFTDEPVGALDGSFLSRIMQEEDILDD